MSTPALTIPGHLTDADVVALLELFVRGTHANSLRARERSRLYPRLAAGTFRKRAELARA